MKGNSANRIRKKDLLIKVSAFCIMVVLFSSVIGIVKTRNIEEQKKIVNHIEEKENPREVNVAGLCN